MGKLGAKPHSGSRTGAGNKMKLLKKLLFLSAAFFLFSCGIEEYKYIPQIPQGNIQRTNNTEATISLNIPSIQQNNYATRYSIYYRIYISNENISSEISGEVLNNISSDLSRDFASIFPSTDPADTTGGTSVKALFENRNYFELDFEEGADIKSILTNKSSGTLRLRFPTELSGFPTATFNGSEYRIIRSGDLISPLPVNDPFFRNTSDLSAYANANANVNADVAARAGISSFAYVSMYIVATGLDNELFTPIYSKPTHISIFKLPNVN